MAYMRIYPDFWRGATGRALRGETALTRCVAVHLLTSQSATSTGLYRIHVSDIAYEVGHGADERAVREALTRLADLQFALYDYQTEFVWVVRMAAFQYDPLPLHAGDFRTKGIDRWYRACPANPFLGPWWDMYSGTDALTLNVERRDVPVLLTETSFAQRALPAPDPPPVVVPVVLPLPSPPLPLVSPLEGASEGLTLLADPPAEGRGGPPGFDVFWKLYPKHRAIHRCQQEWRRQKVTAQDVEVMRQKLSNPYEYWPEWMQNRILDPVNFLKDRRWLDEAAPKAAPFSERTQATLSKTDEIRRMMQKQLAEGQQRGLLGHGGD